MGDLTSLPAPPHSAEAEQAVLGALLLDNGAWPRVAKVVATADFFFHEHRLIFDAIVALMADGSVADIITVGERLQLSNQLEEVGGCAYLNQLAASTPNAESISSYAKIVVDRACRRGLTAAADRMKSAALDAPDADTAVQLARSIFDKVTTSIEAQPRFATVDLADLGKVAQKPQDWYWDGYVPAGLLTYFGGHGGAGKSTIGLLLACCVATGRECLGRPTKQAVVCFFSAEDPRDLLLRRLEVLCHDLDIDYDTLRERLIIVDATECDPVLFAERRVEGLRTGATTSTYDALAKYVEEKQIDLLIVDNASDTYQGDEINRAMVRAFCRSLVNLVRARSGAVVLMAHVDKATSRAGGGPSNSESYSGSTQWHNSARSRLFLVERTPGALKLEHQKCNVGPKLPPLALEWPHDGIPQVQSTAVGPMLAYLEDKDTRALLRLIDEFSSRGEYVATATQSRHHAVALMSGQETFPKRKSAEVFDLLRQAERKDWIARETYKDANRKQHERWVLTARGRQFAEIQAVAPSDSSQQFHDGARQSEHHQGLALCAPSAQSPGFDDLEDGASEGAPCAPSAQRGVRGVEQRNSRLLGGVHL